MRNNPSTTHDRYDLAVFIGRFQPFHNGHLHAVSRGLNIADRVLILIGGDNLPRTPKNPWTVEERIDMIRSVMPWETTSWMPDEPLVHIDGVEDFPYNDQKWIAAIQEKVAATVRKLGIENPKIALIGHEKDGSSFYLRFFPQWKFIDTGYEELDSMKMRIDATKIREFYFEDAFHYARSVLPGQVMSYIAYVENIKEDEMKALREEYAHIKEYKRSWAAAPYAPTFVTCDAVVVASGHVLVVKRGENPGKGLYALPGGFLNQNEYIEDGVLRELAEETQIKLQKSVLQRCIKCSHVFDHPERSLRGRTITHAYLIKLNDGMGLPPVRGADDAAEALWLPLSEVKAENFFEDHFHIIDTMIGKL